MAEGISGNIEKIQQRIEAACSRCGRDPAAVRLVAVTKTVSVDKIREALAAGVTVCGENYMQEARAKIGMLPAAASWHFIGHLQSNKARQAAELFDLIHSVDSLHLAHALDKAAAAAGKLLRVLVQVNISGEQSKHGIDPRETVRLVREMSECSHVRVAGLMTIPPLLPSPEESRPYYAALRRLRDDMAGLLPGSVSLSELSMGMSADFEVAIEEGATLVRVGTAIFGTRPRPGI